MRIQSIALCAWVGLVSCALQLVSPPAAAGSKGGEIMIKFDGAPLVRVIKWMSRRTGRNFVLEDELRRHKITIITGSPVTVDQAYQAFLSALEAEGLHVAEGDAFCTISRRPHRPRRRAVERMSMGDCPPPAGIEKTGPTTWRIERGEFQRWMSDVQCLPKQMRIVPHFKDGKARGFKLFAIRRNTLFDQLGFRNGDVILAIDGQPIDSPDKALRAYQKLKEASSFQVDLLRRGEPCTHTYRVE